MNNMKTVHDSEYMISSLGIKLEEVRCKCGRKLFEIKERKGSVIRVKCKKCGSTVEITI